MWKAWKVSGLSSVWGSRISTLFFIRFSKTYHLGLPHSHVPSQLMALSDNGETEGKIAPKVGGPLEFCGRSAFSSSLQSSVRSFSTKMPGEVAVLRFVKLTENAFAPSKGSELAAGFDLKSAYDYIIPACGKELVKTDLQIQLPEGCYGRVAPRSGLAWKHHIDVGAGVIDADYTGNLGIVMFNHGREDFTVKAGDRVAQLICEKICYPELQEVKAVSETTRGAGGFGSTGKN